MIEPIANVSGVLETQQGMDRAHDAILGAVKKAITKLTLKLQAKVKAEKLSGQVLGVRTGRLRRSINMTVDEVDGSIVGSVGTNVEYAAAHEMGMRKDLQIREHLREVTQVWGQALKQPIEVRVRAHIRHVDLPERSFLRSAHAELASEVQPAIEAAMKADRAVA